MRLEIALLESLAFKEMDEREHVIANETFYWIWDHIGFRYWKENNSSVFWVTGKPGSGKSTLLKYVFKEHKNATPAVFAAFFFNDRGGGLIKSFKGFLQAILHQILPQLQIPNIYRDLITLHKKELAKSKEEFDVLAYTNSPQIPSWYI